MRATIPGLVLGVVLGWTAAGCGVLAPPRFAWTTDAGRQCFFQCKRDFYACRSSCYGWNTNGWCLGSCGDMEATCDRSCPGLREVRR
jgi:hypothetical protein